MICGSMGGDNPTFLCRRYTVHCAHRARCSSLGTKLNRVNQSVNSVRFRLSELYFTIVYKPGVPDYFARVPSAKARDGPPLPIDEEIPVLIIQNLVSPASPVASRKKATPSRNPSLEPSNLNGDVDFPYFNVRNARETPEQESLPNLVTYKELIEAQKENPFCQEVLTLLPKRKLSAFFEDENSILCLVSQLDGRKQLVPLKVLRERVLKLSHHALRARYPGITRMVESFRLTYYWPHMAADCIEPVRQFPHCATNRIRFHLRMSKLRFFPGSRWNR